MSPDKEICASLTLKNEHWVVKINNPLEGSTFAISLLRGGVTVSHRAHDENPIATFVNEGIAGHYQAKVSIHHNKSDSPPLPNKFILSEIVVQDGPLYDLRRWGHVPYFERSTRDEWGTTKPSNGLWHFTEGEHSVDFLLTGMEKLESTPTVLVCFNGAVTSRAGTSAPFFSGANIAGKVGAPIISVSDPTLALSKNIGLGWYAGYEGFSDLPKTIAKLLDLFSKNTGAKLILFGGSGGGFASLLTLSLLTTKDATAFVWNPQTSISKYREPAVRVYLKTAFPKLNDIDDITQTLEVSGVTHDLTNDKILFSSEHSILYIQNQSDWHKEDHAAPFVAKFQTIQQASNILHSERNFTYYQGNWGDGHTPPSNEMIQSILAMLINGKDTLTTALELDRNDN